jgi:hypothetical protein
LHFEEEHVSELETELTPSVDDDLDLSLDIDEVPEWSDDEPAEPWRPSQEDWHALVGTIAQLEQSRAHREVLAQIEQAAALPPGFTPEPVNENGRTVEQELERAELQVQAWLEQHPEAEREQVRARAEDLAGALAEKYGGGPEIAWFALQAASQERSSLREGVTEAVNLIAKAAEARGLATSEEDAFQRGAPLIDIERAVADMEAKYAELLKQYPDAGDIVFGLAALDAVDTQSPRDRGAIPSVAERWGPAATLVEHFKAPEPTPTEHNYRAGGKASDIAFGRIPKRS